MEKLGYKIRWKVRQEFVDELGATYIGTVTYPAEEPSIRTPEDWEPGKTVLVDISDRKLDVYFKHPERKPEEVTELDVDIQLAEKVVADVTKVYEILRKEYGGDTGLGFVDIRLTNEQAEAVKKIQQDHDFVIFSV